MLQLTFMVLEVHNSASAETQNSEGLLKGLVTVYMRWDSLTWEVLVNGQLFKFRSFSVVLLANGVHFAQTRF